jgi:hypothetical protein
MTTESRICPSCGEVFPAQRGETVCTVCAPPITARLHAALRAARLALCCAECLAASCATPCAWCAAVREEAAQ